MTKIICDKCGWDENVDTYEIPVRANVKYQYGKGNTLGSIVMSDKIDYTDVDLCRNCALDLVDYIQQFFMPVNKKG